MSIDSVSVWLLRVLPFGCGLPFGLVDTRHHLVLHGGASREREHPRYAIFSEMGSSDSGV